MHLRSSLAAVGGVAVLACLPITAPAQNDAPFTIRYPPDGATVREKVHVQVPLASIPANGYVQVSINGRFRAAIVPSPTDQAGGVGRKFAVKRFGGPGAPPEGPGAPPWQRVIDT